MTFQIVLEKAGEKKFVADFVGAFSLDNLQRMADLAELSTGHGITKFIASPYTRRRIVEELSALGEPPIDIVRFYVDELPAELLIGVVEC